MALSLIQCLALCGSTCYLQIKSAYSEQCDGHGRLTCQCHERRDRHGSPAHPGIGRRCATSRSHVHLEAHTLSCSPCGSLCCLRWHERLGNGATPCTCTEGFADGGAAGACYHNGIVWHDDSSVLVCSTWFNASAGGSSRRRGAHASCLRHCGHVRPRHVCLVPSPPLRPIVRRARSFHVVRCL